MSKKIFIDNINDETLTRLTDKMLNFEKNNKNRDRKISLLNIIPAVAAILLIIGVGNFIGIIDLHNFFSPGSSIVASATDITDSSEEDVPTKFTPDFVLNEDREIFLNPEVDVNTRIETFIQSNFEDKKIVLFDNFDNMSEELQRFILGNAMYKGSIYRPTHQIGDGLTKKMIDANIKAAFGDIISKLDYSYIPAEYDEERGIYMPDIYGAPNNALLYVFYDIEQMDYDIDRPQYSVKISYIDVNGNLLALDPNGNRLYPPEYITEMENDNREEAIEEFKKEIMQNPQNYERTRLYVEVTDDYIHLLNAHQDFNMPYDTVQKN